MTKKVVAIFILVFILLSYIGQIIANEVLKSHFLTALIVEIFCIGAMITVSCTIISYILKIIEGRLEKKGR